MGITKDVVADFGLDNGGRVDINPTLFKAIKAAATGQDFVKLTFPSGVYKSSQFVAPDSVPVCGSYTVYGAGATINNFPFSSKHIPVVGIDVPRGGTARIQTCFPGQTSLSLTAASAAAGHISRFSVGRWICVTGWSIQGIFRSPYGFPPNFQIFEFVQISKIAGDTLTIEPPLKYFYDQNWPEPNRGNGNQTDAAGPATIEAMDPAWAGDLTVNDLTYNTPGGFSNCYRQHFKAVNGAALGGPIYPSVQQTFTAINHTATAVDVEHDKLVDLVDIRGGNWKRWNVQSSSTNMLKMTGVTISQDINGTPRNAILDGCSIGTWLRIGSTSYGRCETFVCKNTFVPGPVSGGRLVKGTRHRDEGLQAIITVDSGGVLSVPMSCYPDVCEVLFPDHQGRSVLWWAGDNGAFASFRCLSASADNWPATDDRQAMTKVSITAGSGFTTLKTSSPLFTASDVRKVIVVPGAGYKGGTLSTFITAYDSPTSVTVYDPASTSLSETPTMLRWGTCNMYVETDINGGMPSAAVNYPVNGKLAIQVPAGRSVYFENCKGSDRIVDLCQPGAQNKPLDSYTKREFNGQTGFSGIKGPTIPILGDLVSLKVNVIVPYSGQNSLTMQPVFRRLDGDQYTGVSTFYPGKFNMKSPGERIVTIGRTVGARAGDMALEISNPNFLHGSYVCAMSRDITREDASLMPQFTVEIVTDQGFPPAATGISRKVR